MLKRKSECQMLLGIGVCCLISCLFMICYILINHHTKEIDISSFQELKETKDTYFEIEKTGLLNDGTNYIVAASRNRKLNYDFKNWVIGEGNGEYRNMSVLLVDREKQTAFCLKTYPYKFSPEHIKRGAEECGQYGLVAYAKEQMFAGGRSLAISYRGKDGVSYLIYAKGGYEND